MAADELGGAVGYGRGAFLERPAQDRRGEGVVHQQRHALAPRHRGQGGQVGELAERVADRLGQDQRGPPRSLLDRCPVVEIEDPGFVPERLEIVPE